MTYRAVPPFRRVRLPGIGTVEVYQRPNHATIALELGASVPGVRLLSLELLPEHVLELAEAFEAVAREAMRWETARNYGLDIELRPLSDVEVLPDPDIVALALSESEARLMDGNR